MQLLTDFSQCTPVPLPTEICWCHITCHITHHTSHMSQTTENNPGPLVWHYFGNVTGHVMCHITHHMSHIISHMSHHTSQMSQTTKNSPGPLVWHHFKKCHDQAMAIGSPGLATDRDRLFSLAPDSRSDIERNPNGQNNLNFLPAGPCPGGNSTLHWWVDEHWNPLPLESCTVG